MLTGNTHLIETHCHLDMDVYENDLREILKRAQASKIKHIITIGIDEESSQKAVKLARKHQMIRASVGIHPHDVDNIAPSTLGNLKKLATDNKDLVVAYGEIGLDYAKQYSSVENQKKYFQLQLDLAKELQLPLIIHDREAHEDILTLLRHCGPFNHGGVMHCFSGDQGFAEQVLDLGFYISIPGIVTFKNARDLQKVASSIPADRLLLETDGPFLAPVPKRGKRNEPSYLLYIANQVAKLRNTTLEQLAEQTSNNARKLFKL